MTFEILRVRRGVYPGSFDPLTTAHLAIADAAVAALGLERLHFVLSEVPLVKGHAGHSPLPERLAAIESARSARPWLRAATTSAQLIADIAEGFEACVLGADKWHQLQDVSFYGSVAARDLALERLPLLAVAPRHGVDPPTPGPGVVLLDVDPAFHVVSSSGVRAGRYEWRA